MGSKETLAPTLESRQMSDPANHTDDQSVLVSSRKEAEGNQAEDNDDAKHDAYCRVERQVASCREGKVKEDRSEPKPEMRKDVEHRIKYDGRGRMLLRDVLTQFHNAIRFTPKSAYRRGVVECITCDGQLVDAPKAHSLAGIGIAFDDLHPRQSIDAIDDYPQSDDWDEVITSAANVAPQLDETDVERKEHNHYGHETADKEDVIPVPLHAFTLSLILLQNAS